MLFRSASRLELDSDLTGLLSEKHPVVVNLRKIAKYYGGEGYLVMLVRAPSSEAGEHFIQNLVPSLKKHPLVRFVDYKKPTEFIEKNMLLFVDVADLEHAGLGRVAEHRGAAHA